MLKPYVLNPQSTSPKQSDTSVMTYPATRPPDDVAGKKRVAKKTLQKFCQNPNTTISQTSLDLCWV